MWKLIRVAYAQIPNRIVPECDPVGGCDTAKLYELGANIINFMIGLAFLLGVIYFLWGGFTLLTSAGSEKRIESGRKAMTAAVVGIVIVLIAWLAINTFITFFTDCTGRWYQFESLKCG